MNTYPGNSHKSKDVKRTAPTDEKKIQKRVSKPAKTKKKGELRKIAEEFIVDDVKNIKTYVITDVLIPTIKDTIWDILTNTLDMFLFNGTKDHRKRGKSSPKISYRDYYDSKNDRGRNYEIRDRFDYDDLEFDSRGEADAVLTGMLETIDQYGVVSVADMYDMADVTAPYTGNRYGWTSLRNAEVVRVRNAYIIKLPKAKPIGKRKEKICTNQKTRK